MAELVECAKCGRRIVPQAVERVDDQSYCPACVSMAREVARGRTKSEANSLPRRWYLRWRWMAVWALALVGLLAAVSLMTCTYWTGMFPSGEFRLSIRNAGGEPLPGATLLVYRRGTQERACGYPSRNCAIGEDPVSDKNGQIVLVSEHGQRFGGKVRYLFWLVPIGNTHGPKLDCVISAPGYKPYTFEFERLFQSRFESPKARIGKDGLHKDLRVYEHTFTLERR